MIGREPVSADFVPTHRSGINPSHSASDEHLASSKAILPSGRQLTASNGRRQVIQAARSLAFLNFAVDKSEDDLPWLPQFSEMPADLAHYPTFSFRSGSYFEMSCRLSEVSAEPSATSARDALLTRPSSQIIEDILLELYAGKRRDNTEESLKCYNEQLDDWRATLHPDLVIAENAIVSPPPNRVTLK